MAIRYEFIEAITKGNEAKVKDLINTNSCSVNQIVGENSYLYFAIRFKKIQIIKLLLEAGASIIPEVFPPFNKLNNDIIKLLISYDTDIDAKNFNGETYLHLAVKNNLQDIVEDLIKKGADVNSKTLSKQTVLHLAFQGKNEQMIKHILKYEILIDSQDDKGDTALHSAINMQSVEFTKIVLEKGASVNTTNNFGLTPLHSAVLNNNSELVELLLKYGVHVNVVTSEKKNPLHLAVANNSLKIAKLLLKNQVNINDTTDMGITALHTAVITGSIEMVKLLIDNNANVNATGIRDETPLNIAVAYEHEKIAEFLILSGATINHGLNQDMLLHMAVFNKNECLVELLLSNNADITVRYKNGRTALHLAVSYECSKIVYMLLRKGAKVNDRTESGDTSLHMAVENQNYEVCNILLQAYADVNIENNNGRTPLYIAAGKGYLNIVSLLLDHKPDLTLNKFAVHFALGGSELQNKKIILELLAYGFSVDFIIDYNRTQIFDLLKKAVSNGHLGILEYLMKININYNKILFDLKEEKFQTLIHAAVQNNQLQIAKFLIENESDVNVKDEKGHTPIFYAVQNNNPDTTKLILYSKPHINSDYKLFFMVISKGNSEIIQDFLKYYSDINFEDEFGTTALHFAAWNGDEETVQLLFDKGARIKTVESLPQIYFNSQMNSSIQNYYGEDVLEDFRKNMVTTPLHIAVRKNYSDITEAFLENGFTVNMRDGCGRTPLHIACLFHNAGVLDVMMEFNADFYAIDNSGYTCVDYIFKSDQLIHTFLLDKVFAFIHNVDNTEDFSNNTLQNFLNSKEIFIKYLARFNSINGINHENFVSCEKMVKFYKVFKNELERLKDDFICNKVSLYDMLTKKIDSLVLFLNDKNFRLICESKIKENENNKYNKILIKRVRRAKERRFLLKEAEFYFGNIICLPDLVVNKIMSMLPNKDLRSIKQAYEISFSEL